MVTNFDIMANHIHSDWHTHSRSNSFIWSWPQDWQAIARPMYNNSIAIAEASHRNSDNHCRAGERCSVLMRLRAHAILCVCMHTEGITRREQRTRTEENNREPRAMATRASHWRGPRLPFAHRSTFFSPCRKDHEQSRGGSSIVTSVNTCTIARARPTSWPRQKL